VRPSIPKIYLSGPAIEGIPLTMTCLSTGGYPQQDVSWYRGSVSTDHRLIASMSIVNNNLYDVNSTVTLTPTSQDDGVPYMCQSSYSGKPRFFETSQENLKLACINKNNCFVSRFNNCYTMYLPIRINNILKSFYLTIGAANRSTLYKYSNSDLSEKI